MVAAHEIAAVVLSLTMTTAIANVSVLAQLSRDTAWPKQRLFIRVLLAGPVFAALASIALLVPEATILCEVDLVVIGDLVGQLLYIHAGLTAFNLSKLGFSFPLRGTSTSRVLRTPGHSHGW